MEVPNKPSVHAILDDHAAQRRGAAEGWLAEHSRWIFRFTPPSCAWTSTIESFFGRPVRRQLWRGIRHSTEQLGKSILNFIELHTGKEAEAYGWAASAERLIASFKTTPSDRFNLHFQDPLTSRAIARRYASMQTLRP